MTNASSQLDCTEQELRESVIHRAGGADQLGPHPQRRWKYGYFLPAEVYDCVLNKRIDEETTWLDVGGGKTILPHNARLAKELGNRCEHLASVDPSDNVNSNEIAHETHQVLLEDFETSRKFNLITLRMVLEHVAFPSQFIGKLKALLHPEGSVIAFTVWKFAPTSLAAAYTPFWVHHSIKKLVWSDTQPEDTFPTCYLLNSKSQIERACTEAGLKLAAIRRLNDCSVTRGLGWISHSELVAERLFRAARIPYPEHCLLLEFKHA